MRERPEEFRINYEAPLAEGLVFAGLGGHGCVGSMVYPDSSLYANHGTLTNMDAATDWVWSPELGRWVLDFDGSNDYVVLPGSLGIIGAGDHTVMALFNLRSGKDKDIIDNCNGTRGSVLLQVDRDLKLKAHALLSGGVVATGTTTVSYNKWYHGCQRLQGTRLLAILDGVVDAVREGYGAGSGAALAHSWMIGARYKPVGQFWNGQIGDVIAWTHALPLQHIAALADPSNVDLRVGGVPLILPPRRRFWPVVSEQAIPKMVPWHLFQQVSA